MSKLIRKWELVLSLDSVQYNELYNDKLIIKVKNGSKYYQNYEDKLTFFLNNDESPMNFKLNEIFEVFNLAINLPNEDKSERTLKITEFYKAFNKQKIEENKFIIPPKKGFNKNTIYVTKFGIYQKLCRAYVTEAPCYISNIQLVHDFFFNGPIIPELSLKSRKDIKNNIQNSLNITNENKNIIREGFKLFNYDKVKDLHFLYKDELEGKYLRTYNKIGKVIYGGWSNPQREGGENYFSLESFYNKSSSLYIDEIFKDDIKEIKKMIESTIIK